MAAFRQYAAVFGLALSVTTGIADAQVADKPGLTLDGAKQVIAAAAAPGRRRCASGSCYSLRPSS